MKTTIILLSALLITNITVNAQIKEVKGNKHLITVERKIAPFSHLKIIGMHAILEKSSEMSIRIHAESNITDYVQSRVVGDTLILLPDLSISLRDIEIPVIKIPFQHLKSILGSAADIKLLSPVESDSLHVQLQINSDLKAHIHSKFLHVKLNTSYASLTGIANNAQMSLITKSNLEGKDLKIDNLKIWEETLSNAEVHVSQQINATFLGDNKIINIGKAAPKITQASPEKMYIPQFESNRPDIARFYE